MTEQIQTPFLPIYDERNACYRAVIEVTDGRATHQYYCKLDIDDAASGVDIYDSLKQQALFQHRVLHDPTPVFAKLAA